MKLPSVSLRAPRAGRRATAVCTTRRPAWRRCALGCALALALTACASTGQAPGADEAESALVPYVSEQDTLAVREAPTPPAAIEGDPLYKMLVAEFAGQREQLDLALDQYLTLARSTRNPDLAERATKIAVFSRDDDKALEAARLWVELRPSSLDARQILAAMYIRHGDAAAALDHLKYVLAQDNSGDGSRFRVIANLLGREDDRRTALSVMEQLVAERPGDTDALVAYALLAMRAEDLEKARGAMDRLVERSNVNPNLALAYMAVLQKQNAGAEGIAFLEKALKRTPDEFGLRLLYARMLADAQRYEQARLQFAMLLEQAPDNTDVLYALGLLNLQAGKVDAAEENFRALLRFDERTDEASFYLGQIEESRQRPAAALVHYRAVKGGSNAVPAKIRVISILANEGKIDEALAALAATTPAGEEQRIQLTLLHAEILAQQKRYDEALAVFDRALNGKYEMTLLYNRAMLAEQMGRLDLLEADLRTIIAREPQNSQALNALGYTLADRTQRYDEAYDLVKRALAISPNDFFILDSMGWVLYRLGRLEEAVPYLEQARKLRNDPEVAAHLGEVLWMLGRRDDAREIWNTALEAHPKDTRILEAIKRLAP
ncbi:MAG TPA: tetratricopeptide repeat protein [Gammaproteobacteria bacterium]|nr:tetratricopeptide repeat protein [Gammaproteobacteria bacterium]